MQGKVTHMLLSPHLSNQAGGLQADPQEHDDIWVAQGCHDTRLLVQVVQHTHQAVIGEAVPTRRKVSVCSSRLVYRLAASGTVYNTMCVVFLLTPWFGKRPFFGGFATACSRSNTLAAGGPVLVAVLLEQESLGLMASRRPTKPSQASK